MRLTCYGGAGTVTGSNFLIESERGKVLVDCGLEQGADFSAKSVYEPFSYDTSSIDALIVTHAHLDHVGLIPKLVKEGFHGPIIMTPPTRDLAELILRDSVGILGEDARRRHLPPPYEDADVDSALALIETLEYHVEKEVVPGLSMYLRNTGHILGSASVRIRDTESGAAVALTGDIGNSPSPLLPDWEPIPDADAFLMESTYGNRMHPGREQRVKILNDTFAKAVQRAGAILVPAFALERTQLMLYELSNFFDANTLSRIPVFLDSPLAIKITSVYEKWGSTYFKPAAEDEMKREGSLFEFPFLHKTLSHEESAAIADAPNPKIIIAGAGMSHGGRIGRWEAKYLPDSSTTLVIVGYQAPGSPGRRMAEGAPHVRLGLPGHGGHNVRIRAKVEILEGWSAHADRDELLKFAEVSWTSDVHGNRGHPMSTSRLKTIFCALGEPATERFLAQRIHDYLGLRAVVPALGETWEITNEAVKKI